MKWKETYTTKFQKYNNRCKTKIENGEHNNSKCNR